MTGFAPTRTPKYSVYCSVFYGCYNEPNAVNIWDSRIFESSCSEEHCQCGLTSFRKFTPLHETDTCIFILCLFYLLYSFQRSFNSCLTLLSIEMIRYHILHYIIQLLQYLEDLGCPFPNADRNAVIDWLLGCAVQLEYGDNGIFNLTAV